MYDLVFPGDCAAFIDVCKACGATLGDGLAPVMWLAVFVGHAIKWPPVVTHWASLMTEKPPDTVKDLVRMLKTVVQKASGHSWPDMFAQTNVDGLMDAQSGLIVAATQLGIIERTEKAAAAPAKKRQRRGGDASVGSACTASRRG